MESNVLGTRRITQIGILVHDIDRTSQAYTDFFGVEKPQWFWSDTADKARTEYLGGQSEAIAKLALFDMGSLQQELIEPDEQPSTNDFL